MNVGGSHPLNLMRFISLTPCGLGEQLANTGMTVMALYRRMKTFDSNCVQSVHHVLPAAFSRLLEFTVFVDTDSIMQ